MVTTLLAFVSMFVLVTGLALSVRKNPVLDKTTSTRVTPVLYYLIPESKTLKTTRCTIGKLGYFDIKRLEKPFFQMGFQSRVLAAQARVDRQTNEPELINGDEKRMAWHVSTS